MPELPEVETTRLALEPYLLNQRITGIDIIRRDLRWPIPDDFEEIYLGQKITSLRRIGKYILMDAENGHSAIIHLGMSGSMRIALNWPESLKKHDHFLLEVESGATAIFHDPRRFGLILSCPTPEWKNHPLLAKMGPDPLDESRFTTTHFHNGLRNRKSAIKLAVMDQQLIPGMGNIYASEALFHSGIHPERPANSISSIESNRLVNSIRSVLHAALASGGSTLRDYVSGQNISGYFQHRFAVYDRSGQPCTACGYVLEKKEMGGRATYFCTNCQH